MASVTGPGGAGAGGGAAGSRPAPGGGAESLASAAGAGAGRLVSLDAFRGLAVAGMILVNNPGSWAHVYAPLRHAAWHGATPTDLVFPFFLFAVGAAMSFSFAARAARGDSRASLWRHVALRAGILYGIGFLMTAAPRFDFETVRLVGVLARIGMVYLAAGTMVLFLSRRAVAVAIPLLLLGYWALMAWVPVPGFGPGDLSPEGNLAAHLDRAVLGPHMWSGGGGVYDPEGLLSTLPAVASALAGVFAGDLLRLSGGRTGGGGLPGRRSPRAPGFVRRLPAGGPVSAATAILIVCGAALVLVGHLWDLAFPVNKPIWTSSYVAYTTGWALVALGVLHEAIDARGRSAWARPLVLYGSNAIAVFVGSGMLAKAMVLWRLPAADGSASSAYAHVYQTFFASWAGPLNGSLAFAIATVLLWLGVAWALHARRIFIKV